MFIIEIYLYTEPLKSTEAAGLNVVAPWTKWTKQALVLERAFHVFNVHC